jgi:hypothetical protein
MAYQVSWIVQHNVLYIGLSGEIALDDFRGASAQIAGLMDDAYASGSSSMIIGLVDLHDAHVKHLLRAVIGTLVQEIAAVIDPRLWQARPGFIILITTSDTAKLLSSLILRLTTQPLTTVGTLNEALTVVSYMYPELLPQLDAFRDGQQPTGDPG